MKIIGLIILLAGFFWIVCDALVFFTGQQHGFWIWHSQHLPEGDLIPRVEAIRALRELSLALKDTHRGVLPPAALMLMGGLLFGFSRRN